MRAGFSPALASWVRLAAILCAAAVLRLLPGSVLAAAPVLCPFRRFAGIDCFGCGMTHAFHALVRGDVALAISHNALVVPWAALALLIVLRDLLAVTGWHGVGTRRPAVVR